MKDQFYKITLDIASDLFTALSQSANFLSVAKGRVGNHLVDVGEKGVPVVRTTTQYSIPANHFGAMHHKLTTAIRQAFPAAHFNNALIEIYGGDYYKMNFHSDQALDLRDDSYIAVYSCYEHPDQLTAQHIRKLVIKDKITHEESEVSLTHNSVVLFSVAANTKYQHKIILPAKPADPDNRWLGITFRQSKTFIQFDNDVPRFPNGTKLTIANSDQEKEFYQLRGQENRSLDFVYPDIQYTINIADTIPPVLAG